jgi:hypothetical protein
MESTADAGLRAGLLTLVGDRIPGAPPIPVQALHEQSGGPWGGMSGAGVVVGDLVIGVVRSYNLAAGGQSLTVTPLTALDRLPSDLRQRFCDVLKIPDLARLTVLLGAPGAAQADDSALALSADVQEAYALTLGEAVASPYRPVRWNLDELSELRRRVGADGRSISKEADALAALCQALGAKPTFLAAGGSRLELGQLQVIYRREIGAWPSGNSADALLAEAANAGIAERRRGTAMGPLGALARFVVGVSAALKASPQDNDLMATWIGSLGHQLADAQAHYDQRQDKSAWLVIDLGDEPRPGADPWPTLVTWTLLVRGGQVPGEPVRCEPTQEGLRQALTHVLGLVPAAHPLLVDLVLPRALMDAGIEHWPLLEVDGAAEPLSSECHPRLRWSRRRRDARLHNRLRDRTGQGLWTGGARSWLRNDPRRACFLGGRDVLSREDPLRGLLRDGCGFVIWFPDGIQDSAVRQIDNAIRGMPDTARRDAIPDNLPDFSKNPPAVIWDDPDGRRGILLPPLVVPESL